jgi:hypothetical protein
MSGNISKQRVLITVKTYPTLSRKYGETVCTAGVREDGSWVRIYPVPFRRLDENEQYRKFDWLECSLIRNQSDPRPESFRPVDLSEIHPSGHIGTSDNWRERRALLLRTAKVYTHLAELIDSAKANQISLAVFKPKKILDFIWEEEQREWDLEILREIRERSRQLDLFEESVWEQTFQAIPKLPFSFSYKFEDEESRVSELQVLDWETGQLFWNCRRSTDGDEQTALEKVRQKYLDFSRQTDLHFFLGTTRQFHFFASNPWVIVGVFPIPFERQLELPFL